MAGRHRQYENGKNCHLSVRPTFPVRFSFCHPQMLHGNAFDRMFFTLCLLVCVTVCLFVLFQLLTFERPGLETSFWYAGTSSEYVGQVRVIRSSQGHKSQKQGHDCGHNSVHQFAEGLPLFE